MRSCGRTVCFQISAVVTGSALHIWVHISFWILILPGYSFRHWLLVHGSFVFLSGTCTLFCLGAVSSFIAPAPWRLSFSPGPLHHVLLIAHRVLLIAHRVRLIDDAHAYCGEVCHCCGFDLLVSFNWWICSPISWALSFFLVFLKVGNKIDLLKWAPWKWDVLGFHFDHLLQDSQWQQASFTALLSLEFCQLVSSVAQLCAALCDPMDCSTPGVPVLRCFPEFAQTRASSWWCHPTISSSVDPFFSYPQSFPASGTLPVSQLFISGGQSNGVSGSASVFPVNIQGWFPLGLTGLISLLSEGLESLYSTTVGKHQFFITQFSLWSNSRIHTWLTGKTVALPICRFVGRVMSLLFNTLVKVCHSISSKEEALFNFMVAVTVHSDFCSSRKLSQPLFALFPCLFAMKWWDRIPWAY